MCSPFSHTDPKDLKDGYAARGYAVELTTILQGRVLCPPTTNVNASTNHKASSHAGLGRAQDPPLQSFAACVIGEADIFKIFWTRVGKDIMCR